MKHAHRYFWSTSLLKPPLPGSIELMRHDEYSRSQDGQISTTLHYTHSHAHLIQRSNHGLLLYVKL